jgi:hypothetical protein
MSIVQENSGIAYVKGGLFKKFGVELPEPIYEVYVRNKEDWEQVKQGCTVMK